MTASKKPSSKAVFLTVGGLTFVWLATAFILGWIAHPDDHGFTYRGLAANEWGDFLAGVFAPVAFFWLFAAVWLQSLELKAQREELELTRDEMKEQRRVLSAQTEYVGAQTDILRREDEQRQTARQDDFFYEHIDDIVSLLRHNPRCLILNHPHTTDFHHDVSKIRSRQDLEGFGNALLTYTQSYLDHVLDGDRDPLTPEDTIGFYELQRALEKAKLVSAGVSSMARVRMDRYGIDHALIAMAKIEKLTDFPPE